MDAAEGVDQNLIDELLDLAGQAAIEAGQLLVEGFTHQRLQVDTKSTATDMVTEMDRAAEALVAGKVQAARPDDGFLGEEGSRAAGTTGVIWIIDPLDGTTNYVYGYPAYAVSIAAAVDGVVVAGVVHDPSRGETFTAASGRGAYLDGRRLAVVGAPALATALVGTGFAYAADRRAAQARVLVEVLPAVRDIRRAGSAALDLCWVACGRLDAYYEYGLQPWDAAAGGLVAAEAGAIVRTLDGGPPTDDTLTAAPAHLADEFAALLRLANTRW